jgi:hypothetical protein
MPSPAAAFKTAEEAALRASAALATAMGGTVRLYVEVPTNAPMPYVVIGQHEIEDLSEDCGEAHSIVSTVQWWAKLTGAVKGADTVRAMGTAIIAALNTDALAITGHTVDLAIMETPERYATDPDQSSRGLVAIRYETTAQA